MNKNKVRFYVNKKPRQMFKSIVERNGTRAIDTGVFYFPKSVNIEINDDVAYIQDPVNTTYLTGIWNFFDNTRDESGHELDGAEDATYETDATYDDGCNGRVMKFLSGTTKAVKIVDRTATSTSLKHMDFSGQFDIIILYAHNTGTGTLFGKGASGTEVKIEVIANSYVKATIDSTVITGTNEALSGKSGDDASTFNIIRLKRDGANLVTLSVNGTSEGTATVAGDVAATSTDLYIGGDRTGGDRTQGYFAQVRLYTGGFLTDEDFTTLKAAYRQPNTIKFGGIVWKVDEKPAYKIAHCKGYSKILHDTVVSAKTTPTGAGWTSGDNDIVKNTYSNKDGFEILTDLMKAYTGTGTDSVKVIDIDDNITGSSKEYVEYKAVGTLYSNVVLTTINSSTTNSSFSIDGRKILRLESQKIDYTKNPPSFFAPITFKNGHIKVADLGYDDTTLVTQVIGYTQIPIVNKVVTKTGGQFEDYNSTQKQMKLGIESPIEIVITVAQHDGGTPTLTNVTGISEPSGLTEYKIVLSANYYHAIFGAAFESTNDAYTATYKHEDIYPNSGRAHYYQSTSNNASTLGIYAKALYLPQITNAVTNGLVTFLGNFIGKFDTLNRRFKVTAPTLLNNIRENYMVRIVDTFHGVAHDADDPHTNNHKAMVKSVKYYYPEGITEINCGEHMLDSFDLDNAFGTALHELRSTLSQTETSS